MSKVSVRRLVHPIVAWELYVHSAVIMEATGKTEAEERGDPSNNPETLPPARSYFTGGAGRRTIFIVAGSQFPKER